MSTNIEIINRTIKIEEQINTNLEIIQGTEIIITTTMTEITLERVDNKMSTTKIEIPDQGIETNRELTITEVIQYLTQTEETLP